MWDTLVLAQRQICIKRNNRHIDMVAKLSFRPKEKEVRVSTFSSTRLVSNEKQLCLLCHWWWRWRQKLATIPKTIIMTALSITSPPCPSSIIACLCYSRVLLLDLASFAIIKAVSLVRVSDSFVRVFLKVVFCFYGV